MKIPHREAVVTAPNSPPKTLITSIFSQRYSNTPANSYMTSWECDLAPTHPLRVLGSTKQDGKQEIGAPLILLPSENFPSGTRTFPLTHLVSHLQCLVVPLLPKWTPAIYSRRKCRKNKRTFRTKKIFQLRKSKRAGQGTAICYEVPFSRSRCT